MRIFLLTGTAALSLMISACSDMSGDSENTVAETDTENPVSDVPEMGSPVGKYPHEGSAAESSEAEPADLEKSIPEAIRGKWRRLESGDPTVQQCKDATMDNAGKILHIRDTSFSYFETGGRLLEVHERSDTSIRATYDTTYADEHTEADYVFDMKENGKTLIVSQYSKHAEPDPLRYRRCPDA